jgi:hypothetical protein
MALSLPQRQITIVYLMAVSEDTHDMFTVRFDPLFKELAAEQFEKITYTVSVRTLV